jgi:hypothetical protein
VDAQQVWDAWYYSNAIQQVVAELRTMANNVTIELWGHPRSFLNLFGLVVSVWFGNGLFNDIP